MNSQQKKLIDMKKDTVINRIAALENASEMIRGHVEGGGIDNENTPTGSLEDYEKAIAWAYEQINKMIEKYKLRHYEKL